MLTDYLIPVYIFTNSILTGYGVFKLIFFAEWSIPTVLTTVAILFSCILIHQLLNLLHWLLEHFYGKWETVKLDKIRYEVLIGLGGILIVSTVPRIIVYFFADNYYIMCYTILASTSAIQMFSHSFINKHVGKWKINGSLRNNFSKFLLILHLVLFMVTVRIAYNFYKEEEGSQTIVNFQCAYMLLCLACSIDMSQVLREGIQMAKKKEENSDDGRINILKVSCPVCTKEYLYLFNPPRVLIECGHTICQKCANKIKGNKPHLFCPICKAVTVVKGSADLLPKNHGIKEIIEVVNKKYGIDDKEKLNRASKMFFELLVKKNG